MRTLHLLAAAALILATAACGAPAADVGAPDADGSAPDTATSAPDDQGTPEPAGGDEQTLERARDLLGAGEEELGEGVRVGRRGDETFMLTEDYVPGRLTVELDATDDDGTYVVTSVVAELADGPQEVTGQP